MLGDKMIVGVRWILPRFPSSKETIDSGRWAASLLSRARFWANDIREVTADDMKRVAGSAIAEAAAEATRR